ncbi:MAG TPA: fibronectin type III domain-containing protein [Steroidobacteraceae bacterium]|nr:fibronectin type III domain-containing protein [Steroidobacteraceae bacterium]
MMMIRGVGLQRIAQLALAALFCTGLAACGGSGNSTAAASSSASTNPFATSANSTNASKPVAATPNSKSVTLSWSPPTQNSDGSSLNNLAGYTLHYGTASQDYTGKIEITTPTQTSYVVSASNFPPGQYYFAISAYNAQQVSSSLSGEISVTVD